MSTHLQSTETPDLKQVLDRAQASIDSFSEAITDIPFVDKAILYSEAFFLYCMLGADFSGRIVESGRAQGQSTHLFAQIFPNAQIVSIEYDRDSLDVAIAEERLKGYDNVELLFGDANQVMPGLMTPGSIAVIDGPKGLASIHLALRLLEQGRTKMAFLHDLHKGTASRWFLKNSLPETLYSDSEAFNRIAQPLDETCWSFSGKSARGRAQSMAPYHFQGRQQKSYGPTYACIPQNPQRGYGQLAWRVRSALQVKGLCNRVLGRAA